MAKKTTKKKTAKKAAKKRAARSRTNDADGQVASLHLQRMLLSDLQDHPRNDEIRNHPKPDTDKWRELEISLGHDYYDPLVFNSRNGQLVSGHLRKKVLLHMGYTHADVVVVDYDETTHMTRMLSANRNVGDEDKDGMRTFFKEFAALTEFDPAVAGFTHQEVRALIPRVENIAWLQPGAQSSGDDGDEGEDSDHSNDNNSGGRTRELIVTFDNESDMEQLYDELSDRGLECRILNL